MLSKQKSNILARPYAPQPVAALRESVGSSRGIGTVSHAFAAGTPQLITPFSHDQFDNAARVERLGCGFQIHSSGSAQNMRTPLKRLLEDESIQQNCAAIRSKVETGEVSCRKAMTSLERIAAGAFPSIRSDSSRQRGAWAKERIDEPLTKSILAFEATCMVLGTIVVLFNPSEQQVNLIRIKQLSTHIIGPVPQHVDSAGFYLRTPRAGQRPRG